MASAKITIFDTTLRDGEQSPGASMNMREKMEVARALEELGVDVIEAGFPIASDGDFEAVRAVADEIRQCAVAGLARCRQEDIDRAAEAVQNAAHPRIHVFLATSAIHREYKLKMAKEEIVRRAVQGVRQAKAHVDDVEFSPEDASRTEPDFLCDVVEAAIDAGATTVNIPDTVGYAIPAEFGRLIQHLHEQVPNIGRAVISVHCHNDLGLAVANSLAAVRAGARQVECTINGLGERAGNCSLEEVVMAMKVRGDLFPCDTGIRTQRLYGASRLVSSVTGMHVQRNKAIVGENAFAHEAGVHQHGMIQNRTTYEIMKPEDVGVPKTRLVLGKHSGHHAFAQRVEQMGYHLGDDVLAEIFEAFKRLADKKKHIFDSDVEALVEDRMGRVPEVWRLEAFLTTAGTGAIPTAAVRLERADQGDKAFQDAACGDGPIDAVFNTMERITGVSMTLRDYQVRSVSSGKDAQGEVKLEVECEARVFRGRAISTDIVEASARAYLQVINKIVALSG